MCPLNPLRADPYLSVENSIHSINSVIHVGEDCTQSIVIDGSCSASSCPSLLLACFSVDKPRRRHHTTADRGACCFIRPVRRPEQHGEHVHSARQEYATPGVVHRGRPGLLCWLCVPCGQDYLTQTFQTDHAQRQQRDCTVHQEERSVGNLLNLYIIISFFRHSPEAGRRVMGVSKSA